MPPNRIRPTKTLLYPIPHIKAFRWASDRLNKTQGGIIAFVSNGYWLDGNAMGTPYWRGGLTRVNERGGEIMNLPSGTQIIPHDVSVKAAGGRGVTVNVTIQGNVIGNREYTEQVGEYVGRKVLAALGNT